MTPASSHPLLTCDAERTAQLLDFNLLVEAIAQASQEYETGTIRSPERMVVPLTNGGVMLSMPATAPDIAIHKLVNVQPANLQQNLPTIHGVVTVCDGQTGKPLCQLDGPEVTGRRTAAVTLLAIRSVLQTAPLRVLFIGTGAQARFHLQALHAAYPECEVLVRGMDATSTQDFCDKLRHVHPKIRPCPAKTPDNIDVVVTMTTSLTPVYDELALPQRLVIGVGAFKPEMAEIGKRTLDDSHIYADDPAGARHEAGDLLRAGIDWARVKSLADLLRNTPDPKHAVVFKSVGTAAWDLAAARVALNALRTTN